MLKHKRSYVPEALTATEKRILARKSWVTRIWMATGKKVYIAITRGLLQLHRPRRRRPASRQRRAGDRRAAESACRRCATSWCVAFPDRRAGTGLYAFVEGNPGADESALADFVARSLGRAKAPERLQLVEALPRRADGSCAPKSFSSSR